MCKDQCTGVGARVVLEVRLELGRKATQVTKKGSLLRVGGRVLLEGALGAKALATLLTPIWLLPYKQPLNYLLI